MPPSYRPARPIAPAIRRHPASSRIYWDDWLLKPPATHVVPTGGNCSDWRVEGVCFSFVLQDERTGPQRDQLPYANLLAGFAPPRKENVFPSVRDESPEHLASRDQRSAPRQAVNSLPGRPSSQCLAVFMCHSKHISPPITNRESKGRREECRINIRRRGRRSYRLEV